MDLVDMYFTTPSYFVDKAVLSAWEQFLELVSPTDLALGK